MQVVTPPDDPTDDINNQLCQIADLQLPVFIRMTAMLIMAYDADHKT